MKTRILSFVLMLTLLVSCFSLTISAIVSQDPVYTEGGTVEGKDDAFVAIRSELAEYQHGDTFTVADDGYIGIPVDITIYNDPTVSYVPSTLDTIQYPYETTEPNYNSATEGGKPIALYVINTNTDRIGTDSDVNIITSLLKEGYIVAVVDYKNEKRAKSPDLDWSLQRVRAMITGKKLSQFTDSELNAWLTFNYILPAGYSIKRGVQFFNFEEHGAYGVLDFIVDVWNVDLKYTGGSFGKGNRVSVIWGQKELYDGTKVYQDANGVRCIPQGDGYVYYTQNADYSYTIGDAVADSTTVTPLYKSVTEDAVWENEETREIKVRYTNAEDFWDCVKPNGDRIDLNLYSDIYYPVNPKNEVPVMILASSSQNRAGATQTADRPISTGYMFTGYAFVNYDHAYVPMSRADHFDYFEGDAALGRDSNFTVVGQCGVEAQTAAIRILRYLSERYHDIFHFDVGKFGVWGHSKGAHVNCLAEEHPEEKINQGYFPGHSGEVPENQPWTTYSDGTPIPSNVQLVYPSKGGNGGYSTTKVPMFISHPEADTYLSENARYAILLASLRGADVPSFAVTMEGVGHTTVHGYNEVLDVDMYQALFDFTDYFLYDRPSTYSYSLPINGSTGVDVTDDIVLKFTGPIPESEIVNKVRIVNTQTGESARGVWESACGGNEWTFHPMGLEGGNVYRIDVPNDLTDENGNAIKQKKSVTYFRTSYENAFKAAEVVSSNGSLTLSKTEEGANGVYFVFNPLTIDHNFGTSLRFSSTSKASTAVNVYGITTLDENNLSSSTLTTTPIRAVGISGAEIVEVDVSEYIASLPEGAKPAFYVEAAKVSGTTTIYDCDFEDTSSRGPLASKSSKYWTPSPDGTIAYTIEHGKLYFISNIFTTQLTKEDYGRWITVSFDAYSTITRDFFTRFTVKGVTPQVNEDGELNVDAPGYQYVDHFNNAAVTVMLKENEWQRITLNYYIDDYTYTEDYIQKISLNFGSSGRNLEGEKIYIDNLLVTETVVDATVSDRDTMTSIVPTLAVQSAVLNNADVIGGGYVVNGDASDTVFDSKDGYHISGPASSGMADVRISYMSIDLAALDFKSAYAIGLNIKSGNGKILVYGLTPEAMDGFDLSTLTYQNAPAFDRASLTAKSSAVHNGAPIASVNAEAGHSYLVGLSRYLLDMKAEGATRAVLMLTSDRSNQETISFSLLSNTIEITHNEIKFDDLTNITSSSSRYTEADVFYQLPASTDTTTITLDSTIFYGTSGKSMKISNGTNSDFYVTRLTRLISPDKAAAHFTSEDVGKTYYISFKLYIPSSDPYTDGAITKLYMGLTQIQKGAPEGGANYYGTSASTFYNPVKLQNLKIGEWNEITYSFTVIDQMVGARAGAYNTDTRPLNFSFIGIRGDAYVDDLRYYSVESTQDKEYRSMSSLTVGFNKTGDSGYYTKGGDPTYQQLAMSDASDGYVGNITSMHTYDRVMFHNTLETLSFTSENIGDTYTYFVRLKVSKAGTFLADISNREYGGSTKPNAALGFPTAKTITVSEDMVNQWFTFEYSFVLTEELFATYDAKAGAALPTGSGTFKYNGKDRFGPRFYLGGFNQTESEPVQLYVDTLSLYRNALDNEGKLLSTIQTATASLKNNSINEPSVGTSEDIDFTLKKGYFFPEFNKLYRASLTLNSLAHAGRTFRLWALVDGTLPENLTWNNAPANDLEGEGVLPENAFGGTPVAIFTFDENGMAVVDVTDYINTVGDGEVIFVLTADMASSEDGDAIVQMPVLSLYTVSESDTLLEGLIEAHNVTITDKLSYNLYIPADKKVETIEYNGEKYDFAKLPVVINGGKSYKRFTAEIVAKDAFGKHMVTVTLEDGNIGVYNLCVQDYLDNLYEMQGNEKLATLAGDMISYLAASVVHFYQETNPAYANGAIAIRDGILGAEYDTKNPAATLNATTPVSATESGMAGAGLNLAERPTIYFVAGEGYENMTPVFMIHGETVTYETMTDGTNVYFNLTVEPWMIRETVTYTIGDKSGSFNLRAYYDWAKNTAEDAELAHLVERLYRYSESLENYLA